MTWNSKSRYASSTRGIMCALNALMCVSSVQSNPNSNVYHTAATNYYNNTIAGGVAVQIGVHGRLHRRPLR